MVVPILDTPLEEADSFHLFRARVEQRKPDLSLEDEVLAEAIRTILIQTEGHPLSIELVAAWVGVRSLHGIADDLKKDPLKLLRVPPYGHRLGPARHRSIEDCFGWVAGLLPQNRRRACPASPRCPTPSTKRPGR